jgi:hypothetical protein
MDDGWLAAGRLAWFSGNDDRPSGIFPFHVFDFERKTKDALVAVNATITSWLPAYVTYGAWSTRF